MASGAANAAEIAEGFAWYDEAFDTIAKSVAGGIELGPNGLPIIPDSDPPTEINGNETPKP